MVTRKQLAEKIIPDLKNRFKNMESEILKIKTGTFEYDVIWWVIRSRSTMFWVQSDYYKADKIKDCDAFTNEWINSVKNLEAATEYYVRYAQQNEVKHYKRKITLSDLNNRTPKLIAELQEYYNFTNGYFRSPRGQHSANAMGEEIKKKINAYKMSLNVYNNNLQVYGNYDFDFIFHGMEILPLQYSEQKKVILELDKLISCL